MIVNAAYVWNQLQSCHKMSFFIIWEQLTERDTILFF